MLEVEKVITKFRDYVIQQSRSNLSKSSKNNSKALYNSLKGEVVTENNYTIVGFQMADYGTFVDLGVKGADPSKVSKNAKITGQQAPNSPYSFKTKRPPSKFLEVLSRGTLAEDYELVNGSASIEFFVERFENKLAGVTTTFDIAIQNPMTKC